MSEKIRAVNNKEGDHRRLIEHIIGLSESKEWLAAKNEWEVTGLRIDENEDNCPCGHFIKELCFIRNKLNNHLTYVGNVCIKKFMGIDVGNAFEGLKRIIKNKEANPNGSLLDFCLKNKIITDKDYKFMDEKKNKRNFSEAQLNWKISINKKIVDAMTKKLIKVDDNDLKGGIKAIQKEPTTIPNGALLSYALENNLISENDYRFLYPKRNFKNLSIKQDKWKNDINRKIISKLLKS